MHQMVYNIKIASSRWRRGKKRERERERKLSSIISHASWRATLDL